MIRYSHLELQEAIEFFTGESPEYYILRENPGMNRESDLWNPAYSDDEAVLSHVDHRFLISTSYYTDRAPVGYKLIRTDPITKSVNIKEYSLHIYRDKPSLMTDLYSSLSLISYTEDLHPYDLEERVPLVLESATLVAGSYDLLYDLQNYIKDIITGYIDKLSDVSLIHTYLRTFYAFTTDKWVKRTLYHGFYELYQQLSYLRTNTKK